VVGWCVATQQVGLSHQASAGSSEGKIHLSDLIQSPLPSKRPRLLAHVKKEVEAVENQESEPSDDDGEEEEGEEDDVDGNSTDDMEHLGESSDSS